MLALDGRPGRWCPPGVRVVGQGHGPLDRRLAPAWSQAGRGPALQIGMDTPQVGAADLDGAMSALVAPRRRRRARARPPTAAGGRSGCGVRDPTVFLGVPTSRPDTGARQAARLAALGLRTRLLAPQPDVDTWPDAVAVAAQAPATRFAGAVGSPVTERSDDARTRP